MMKDKNKGKKTLAAVGAVVAAGLTPGFVVASAAGSPIQGSNVAITAADVVAIDGTTFSFDELYAMQRGDTIELPDIILEDKHETLYGAVVVAPYRRKIEKDRGNDNTIYRAVEQMPQFPGGEAALIKYIQKNLKYPQGQEDVEGKVLFQFVVKKNGKIGEVKVLSVLGKDFDQEAIRVVKSLPKFKPGRQNGKAVDVWYTLHVPYKQK
jgi:TonB family protein